MRHALTIVTASPLRRGTVFVYLTVAMTVMFAMASIGVDYGKVVVTRSEMQTACDAAARYGAAGLENILDGKSAAAANAVVAAAANKADGKPVLIDPTQDVQLVIWNNSTHNYTVTTDPTKANAVRVSVSRTAARGNPTPLMFGAVVRHPTHDIVVSSIAAITGDTSYDYTVPATSSPFLSGMPSGSKASKVNPHTLDGSGHADVAGSSSAPAQSPVYANNTTVTAGSSMSFDGVIGTATNDVGDTNTYTADGKLAEIDHNYNPDTGQMSDTQYYNENHIADMRAPINSLVGIFLNDKAPTQNAAPNSNLDFATQAARDYQTLSPDLQQIFFIGDGRTSNGDVQHVVVPPGATRLFIATWDGYEWNNNKGSFTCTIHNNGKVSLVQ